MRRERCCWLAAAVACRGGAGSRRHIGWPHLARPHCPPSCCPAPHARISSSPPLPFRCARGSSRTATAVTPRTTKKPATTSGACRCVRPCVRLSPCPLAPPLRRAPAVSPTCLSCPPLPHPPCTPPARGGSPARQARCIRPCWCVRGGGGGGGGRLRRRVQPPAARRAGSLTCLSASPLFGAWALVARSPLIILEK